MHNLIAFANKRKEILQENTFYGKNPITLKMEGTCANILESYRKKDFSKCINSYIPSLEKDICELFGFTAYFIEISSTNTMTIPSQISYHSIIPFNPKYQASKGKYGPTYKKEDDMKATMFIGHDILGHPDITAEEMVAIILHEIGHSFDKTIKRQVLLINPVVILIGIISSVQNIFKKPLAPIIRLISTLFAPLLYVINVITKSILDVFGVLVDYTIIGTFGYFSAGAEAIQSGQFIFTILGADGEKFSDAFSASYGYGSALTTGLDKLQTNSLSAKIIRSGNVLPIFKAMYQINEMIAHAFASILMPHYKRGTRERLIKEYMKDCISTTNNPRLKAELQSEVKKCYDFADKLSNDDAYSAPIKAAILDDNGEETIKEIITELKTNYPNIDL